MTNEISLRRRAIYTGLKPFLEESGLLNAVLYWENHFAGSPRFTLQRFVAELCQDNELRPRRAEILLSLVEAMGMSEQSLLPDPFKHRTDAVNAVMPECLAFNLLMTQIMEIAPRDVSYSTRLDLISSLDIRKLPANVVHVMQDWLNDRAGLMIRNADPLILRSLVNRTYVILCERLGPVQADKVLAAAVAKSSAINSALTHHINQLL